MHNTYMYDDECGSKTGGRKRIRKKERKNKKRQSKKERKLKKRETSERQRGGSLRGYVHIYSDASPRSPARIGHEKEVQDAIATYTTTQYILIHASHTYTSTSQSRDHVIMSELGITILHGAHVHRRSTIDFAPIILADPLVKGVHPAAATPNPPRSVSSLPPSLQSPVFSLSFGPSFSFSCSLTPVRSPVACLYTLRTY